MSKTLIVVDVQNDFVTGSLGSQEAQAIIENVKNKIAEYEKNGDAIIFTRDTHGDDYFSTYEGRHLPIKHCIRDTGGWQIVDGLETQNCRYINKETFAWSYWNSCHFTDDVEIIGLCTDICVVSNAMVIKSMYPETEIIVDASCCAGTTPEAHNAALQVMKSCQITVIGEENA